MEDGQIEIISTKGQIKNFKKNFVWIDIQNEIKLWVKGFEIEKGNIVDEAAQTNPSTASVLLHLGDLNGRDKCAKYLLSLPDLFLSILEERADDVKRK